MDGLEFVPMFWGNKSIPQFGGVPQLVSSGGVQAVLGMNEYVWPYRAMPTLIALAACLTDLQSERFRPTIPGQSELSPAQAAELWMQYMEPLKQANSSLRLGSPAMANGPAGIPWMQEFLGNCTACSVDFTVVRESGLSIQSALKITDITSACALRLLLHQCVRLHQLYSKLLSYSGSTRSVQFRTDCLPQKKTGYHDAFQKPVWVTEWGCVNFVRLSSNLDRLLV